MRRLLRARTWSSAIVVTALVAIYFTATTRASPTVVSAPGRPARTAVESALRACAGPGSTGATRGAVAVASMAGSAEQGKIFVTPLTPMGSTPGRPVRVAKTVSGLDVVQVPTAPAPSTRSATSQTAGTVRTVPGRGGVLVSAVGPMARGLEVEQTYRSGLASAACGRPGTSFWFVTPGTRSASQITLYLMNTDSQAADASVSAATDNGPLLNGTDTGITVPPHGMVMQSLSGLLHGSRVVALQVSTSLGRIVPALRISRSSADPGVWVPAAQQPSRNLLLPGIPASSGSRVLYIDVPGTQNAQLKITAVTGRGSYRPTGGSGIELPGESAAEVPLPSLSGLAAAIKVTANVPVLASLSIPGGPVGAPGAFTASTSPVQQQAVLADNPVGGGASAELVLSAPKAAAQVRITEGAPASASSGRTVSVAAGRTAVVKVNKPAQSRSPSVAVVVTTLPGSGPVYVGRVIFSGHEVSSILPAASSLTWIALPAVRDSLFG